MEIAVGIDNDRDAAQTFQTNFPVKGGVKSGHVAEQECTSRSSTFSEDVRLRLVSSGALSGSEVGGVLCARGIAG